MQITAHEMYPENTTVVEQLLNDMATLPIQKVGEYLICFIFMQFIRLEITKIGVYVCLEEKDGGTQFKLTITYKNGMKALFKPKR